MKFDVMSILNEYRINVTFCLKFDKTASELTKMLNMANEDNVLNCFKNGNSNY